MVTNFHLLRTKSALTGKDISWAKQFGPSDLHATLENHMSVNAPTPRMECYLHTSIAEAMSP